MESRKRGNQILMVAEKIAEPAVECPVCRSTLVEDAGESLKCLRCRTRRIALPAASLAQPDGERIRFLKTQQAAWMSFLDAAERRHFYGRLLDLGCADGTFMQMARQRGWDVWGVEPGDYETTVASPAISMRMITAGSWSERFMPESCQMITLWDSLHQVVEPAETLKTAYRLLAPEGHLMIRMINPARSEATKASKFLRRFFGLGSACWLYEIDQLKTLLSRAGFTDLQIDHGVRVSGTGDDSVYIPRSLHGSRSRWFSDASPWLFVLARRPAVPPARRLRALHIVENMEDGETADLILAGIEALPFNRYQSDLIVGKIHSTPRVTALRKQGVRVRPQDLFHPWSQPLNIWHAYRALVPLIEEGGYDIVHAYGWKAGVIGRLAGARVRRRSKRRLAKKIIYQPMGHRFYGFYGRWISMFVGAVERFLAGCNDALIVPTERGAFEFVARHAGQFDKTAVIPQGALLAMNLQEAAAARGAMGVLEDGWFIGYWGALEQRNGLEDLLQAAQSIFSARVDARIIVVGKGAARTYFHDMAKQLSISDRVHFLEDHMDLELFLSTVDLVVVPDPTDGVPRILLQSAAAGKPVLTTQVGGHSSIVIDGVTGRLVPPHDPGAIAKMALTIGQDSKEMSRFGAAARTWVQKLEDGDPQFSEQRMASLMRSLYEELG
jgi:glycosyltransferase involved in cell wall biosynthesis/SAM-dependent methyltransferase